MKVVKTDQEPLIQQGFEALLEKLGPQKASQLWQLFTVPNGDYREMRGKMFAGKTVKSLAKEAKKFNR